MILVTTKTGRPPALNLADLGLRKHSRHPSSCLAAAGRGKNNQGDNHECEIEEFQKVKRVEKRMLNDISEIEKILMFRPKLPGMRIFADWE